MSGSAAHDLITRGCSFCALLLGQVCHGFRAGASGAVAAGVLHNG